MSADIQQKMAQLQAHYRQQLPQRLDEVAALRNQLLKARNTDAEKQLLRLLHNMAGSGTTFGLPKVTEIARELEHSLQVALNDANNILMTETIAKMDTGLNALRAITSDSTVKISDIQKLKVPTSKAQPRDVEDRRLIYLVDDDKDFGKAIAQQIQYFGYDIRVFTHLEDVVNAIKEKEPTAIIMDMEFPEGTYSGAKAAAAIQNGRGKPLPIIYLTSHGEFLARLEAIRAGCNGYFTKPVDMGNLIDYMDKLLSQEDDEPYRILIIDDTSSLAEFNALTLQQAGMQTLIVTDPALALEQLEDFSPELILMDMYMPECGGEELAQVIRQYPEFVSIPIVFLSGERDLKKQLAAMRHGGDDFLTKPIDPEHLVASVSIRAERYRSLRGYMIHDGLTGLLNHSRIEDELNAELSRSTREGRPFAFVMVDLDHFKSVNDTYGHGVGDRVLKSLSRMLKERLRKTDRIGRYGGEEFAVILPNTNHEQAFKIMDNVREAFSKIIHRADDEREFVVTMSCGVACYSGSGKQPNISKLADDALYEAKRGGRNRVVVAR